MLEIRHFSKTYTGGKKAVEDLNLTVEAGSIYGFIGHKFFGCFFTSYSTKNSKRISKTRIIRFAYGSCFKKAPVLVEKCIFYGRFHRIIVEIVTLTDNCA